MYTLISSLSCVLFEARENVLFTFVFPESSATSLFYQTINKHEFVMDLTVFSQNSYVEDLTSNVTVSRDRIFKEVIKLSESYGWGPSPMRLVSI